ncbi:MAG: hypothetical protein ACD_39C01497G0005 [uncultured bacterium]|nr:MAG: hypothetical protein ACD_39C01497G0005 [uncultured bacterium]
MSLFKGFSGLFSPINSLNAEVGSIRINRVCEKVGALVGGERGRRIGKKIDDHTSDITIKL